MLSRFFGIVSQITNFWKIFPRLLLFSDFAKKPQI